MTGYELVKFIHVLFAIAWVGASITMQVVGFRARSSDDPAAMKHYADIAGWMGPHYFAPISGLTLVFGVWLVIISGWNFSEAWIVIGIALYAVAVLTGMLYLAPEGEKIRTEMLAASGRPEAALQRRIHRIELVTRVELVLLVLIVADMVIKPGA